MAIHIFTGGKGGVGKTIFALCASIYFLKEQHARTNIIDLNYVNNDLSSIIQFKIDYVKRIFTEGTILGTSNGKIYRLSNLFKLPARGTYGFWQWIKQATNDDLLCNNWIVDTNLHLHNLFDNSQSLGIGNTIRSINKNIYIWFIWTLSLAKNDKITAEMRKVVENLVEVCSGSDKFNENHVIHILNPYSLYSHINLFDILRGAINTNRPIEIEKFKALRNSMTCEQGIKFLSFMGILKSAITKFSEEETKIHPEEKFNSIADRIFSNSENCRPWNLSPITIFNPNIIGYTDNYAIDKSYIMPLEDLKLMFGNIYTDIAHYLKFIP